MCAVKHIHLFLCLDFFFGGKFYNSRQELIYNHPILFMLQIIRLWANMVWHQLFMLTSINQVVSENFQTGQNRKKTVGLLYLNLVSILFHIVSFGTYIEVLACLPRLGSPAEVLFLKTAEYRLRFVLGFIPFVEGALL